MKKYTVVDESGERYSPLRLRIQNIPKQYHKVLMGYGMRYYADKEAFWGTFDERLAAQQQRIKALKTLLMRLRGTEGLWFQWYYKNDQNKQKRRKQKKHESLPPTPIEVREPHPEHRYNFLADYSKPYTAKWAKTASFVKQANAAKKQP